METKLQKDGVRFQISTGANVLTARGSDRVVPEEHAMMFDSQERGSPRNCDVPDSANLDGTHENAISGIATPGD